MASQAKQHNLKIAVTAYNTLAQEPITRVDERRIEFDRPLMTQRKRGSPSLTRTDGPIDRLLPMTSCQCFLHLQIIDGFTTATMRDEQSA